MKKFLGLLLVLGTVMTGSAASAIDLGPLLGVVGGGLLVDAVAGPLNDFINTITLNKGVGAKESTKVVPIVSVGSGTRIGAAQVSGPKNTVDKTKAVAQIETSFQGVRIKILVPIDALNPLDRFRRVQGVGVSAIIDLKL
ncbi:hypothetical protein [Aminiphilus circumscriptus]|jgi:hypothetical protein|uniref:hypothetical protein n=1 Tax=Aminiphilus circumscriptus TaxID=290732 RepID=UPI000492CB11|nr:hypothetical protein [Aminiphilus circumscriptus]